MPSTLTGNASSRAARRLVVPGDVKDPLDALHGPAHRPAVEDVGADPADVEPVERVPSGESRRTVTTTSSPRATSRRTTWAPMNPVAPVTSVRGMSRAECRPAGPTARVPRSCPSPSSPTPAITCPPNWPRSREFIRSACTCTGPRAPSARATSSTTTRTTAGSAPAGPCPPPRSRRSGTSWPSTSRCWSRRRDRLGPSGRRHVRHRARRRAGPRPARRPRAARVHVVDSATACGGEGLVVLAAAAAARSGADGAAVAAARPRGALGTEDVVLDRHPRVPAPRRADRRRPGVAGLGAEDQADPHRRVRDHPGGAGAHLAPRLRADGRPARRAGRRRRRRVDGPAHPGARARPRSSPPAAPSSSGSRRGWSPRSGR